eukprot:286382_1
MMFIYIFVVWIHGVSSLRIKYESCRGQTLRIYNNPNTGQSAVQQYPGCSPSLLNCDEISDTLYETVDRNEGLTITENWATVSLTIDHSSYDSNANCLYYDNINVLKKNSLYQLTFDGTDNEECGCEDVGNTRFCYECFIYFCSDDQPLICYDSDGMTPAPTPYPTPIGGDDFCDRDILNINSDATICGMFDLNNLDSHLFDDMKIYKYGVEHGILYKDEIPYLLLIYRNDEGSTIYADIFDMNGHQIISNHVIVDIDINSEEIREVKLAIKPLKSGIFGEDNVDFMVIYQYYNAEVIKYTLSQFVGDSVTNIHESKDFSPSMSGYLEIDDYTTPQYLYNADSFMIFGECSPEDLIVIVFDMNGNILNDKQVPFAIDFDGDKHREASCGFNISHDVCFLNWERETTSVYEEVKAAMIAIQKPDDTQTQVSISMITGIFETDYKSLYKSEDTHKATIISPEYNHFFVPVGGMLSDGSFTMYAAEYTLDGSLIKVISRFGQLFNDEQDTYISAECYSSYQSGIIVCLSSSETYIFDSDGYPLIDDPQIFLDEDMVNNYIKQHHGSAYRHFGDMKHFSTNKKIVPLTSNDFWVVFGAAMTNVDNNIILGAKMSLYDGCCGIYTMSPITSTDFGDDVDSDSDEDGLDGVGSNQTTLTTPAIAGIVVGGFVVLFVAIIGMVCCVKKRRSKEKGVERHKYETTDANEED